MTQKQLFIYSFTFSSIAGIVNILGIMKLDAVLTNVTGHFSSIVVSSGDDQYQRLFVVLTYALMYSLGAFWAYSCFFLVKKKSMCWLKLAPISVNIFIFIFSIFSNQLFDLLLIFAMSSQNAIGSNYSQGHVKPSQITGVVMNAMQDLSKYLFYQINPSTFNDFLVKFLNILGFMFGGFMAFYNNAVPILWIPILYYTILLILVLKKRL